MTETKLTLLSQRYKSELLDNVIPFWEKNSIDSEHGAYLTCLDRYGKVFDTDKFTWMQARQMWMFSHLYTHFENRPAWKEVAMKGAGFLRKNGRDEEGNWYFALNREGKPLIQAYNIFSDCFACMAFAGYYRLSANDEDAEIAATTFMNILSRMDNPKGKYNKQYPGTRNLKSLSLPMILCNLVLEVEPLISSELFEQTLNMCINEIMEVFYDSESGLLMENINADGTLSDTFEGRLLNPGHAMEALWFIMDLAERINSKAIIEKAVEVLLQTVKYGWDRECDGIFYFLDRLGKPLQQLEWDQKLWWVHIEAMISFIKAYYLTGNKECYEWFEKIDSYTWARFPDPEYGEWFAYLNRRGEVLLNLKGGKWKGCFHLPRGLYIIFVTLEKIITER